LAVWVVPASVLFTPLILLDPTVFAIIWVAAIWLLYPMGLASVLYSQNWLHFIHAGVVGRMIGHFPSLIYVHLVTFAMFAASVWFIGRIVTDGLVWVFPAA